MQLSGFCVLTNQDSSGGRMYSVPSRASFPSSRSSRPAITDLPPQILSARPLKSGSSDEAKRKRPTRKDYQSVLFKIDSDFVGQYDFVESHLCMPRQESQFRSTLSLQDGATVIET